MFTSLLSAAIVAASTLLPFPIPTDSTSTETSSTQTSSTQTVPVAATLSAADGRLKRGCKDYKLAYSVSSPSEDWTLLLSIRDRHNEGVNSQALIGPNDPTAGVLTFRLCRWATVPGLFTVSGELVSYETDDHATTVPAGTQFYLRKRNR